MKKLLFVLFALFININSTLAGDNSNYLFSENGCVIDKKITGTSLAICIQDAINFGMAILGGVVILFIVIGAYKILFGGVAGDKARGKGNIINALTGFVIACSARLIISILLQNLK